MPVLGPLQRLVKLGHAAPSWAHSSTHAHALSPQTSTKLLIEIVTKVITTSTEATDELLRDINSPLKPNDPQPRSGICTSELLTPLCARTLATYRVGGGCATIGEQCYPPEFVLDACIGRNSYGAWVISQGAGTSLIDMTQELEDTSDGKVNMATTSRPKRAKQAYFAGCCVGGGAKTSGSTCKKIRAGKMYTGGVSAKTRTMNPLKQVRTRGRAREEGASDRPLTWARLAPSPPPPPRD